MDVRTILDAPMESVARAASNAADVVDHAVARADHAMPLPGRKARRRRHLRGWFTRNRRTLLVTGGLGAIAVAAVAARRHLPAHGGRPSPGAAAMATSGAISPEAAPGSTSEYARPGDPAANGQAPRGAGLHSADDR